MSKPKKINVKPTKKEKKTTADAYQEMFNYVSNIMFGNSLKNGLTHEQKSGF